MKNSLFFQKLGFAMLLLSLSGFLFGQTSVGSLLQLYNVREGLSGSYVLSANIDLSPTKPVNVNVWTSQDYNDGDYVKYTSGGTEYTYICILNTTTNQDPTNTTYWKQLWKSAEGWLPIGNATTAFTGIFNGKNGANQYTISNLYINRGASSCNNDVYPTDGSDDVGLFGFVAPGSSVNTQISNVILTSIDVTGRRATGSLIGKVRVPNTATKTVLVSNCTADGGTVKGFGATGGLVGANNSFRKQQVPIISFCWANITVSATHPSNVTRNPDDRIGNTSVYNPYNIKYGGLVGCNETGVTRESYARGNVSGGDRVGGLAGCSIDGAILNCFSTGSATRNISPGNWEGGVGGLVGRVTGFLPPGLGGYNGSGSVQNSYWNTQTSGNATSAAGTGLTTIQMGSNTNFTNWDFTNVWTIVAGYPSLISNPTIDFFYQTIQNGVWENVSQWQRSPDNAIWASAPLIPSFSNSKGKTIYNDISINSNLIIDQTTINSAGKLTVTNGNTLTVFNGDGTDLQISGALVITGTFVVDNGASVSVSDNSTITFNGSSAQSTGERFPNTVYNLIVDNSAGVTITNSLVVNGTMTVINGDVTYNANPTVDGYDNSSKYIKIAKNDVLISTFSSATTVPEVSIYPAFVNRTWTISGTFSGTKNITFTWTNTDDNNFPWSDTAKPAVFQGGVEITEGVVWDSANPRLITVPVTTFASKADFKIGLQDGDTLPVELASFTAILISSGRVRLDWVTHSETNVNGFYLWRSSTENICHAQKVSPLIQAHNTSNTMLYSFEDREIPGSGIYRYWLQNVDLDGFTEYHGPVLIELNNNNSVTPPLPLKNELSSLYPNPFNPTLRIEYSLKENQEVEIDIFNLRGQLIRRLYMGASAAGRHTLVWDGRDDFGNASSTGVFLIRMKTSRETFTRKALMIK